MSGWEVTIIRADHISIAEDEAEDAGAALELARELVNAGATDTHWLPDVRPAP